MISIAQAIGTSHGNLSNWLSNDSLSAERVILISYEVGADPVDALEECGYLKPTKKDEEATNEELAARIIRLAEMIQERPGDNVVSLHQETNVHPISHNDDIPQGAVAYDGPDEDQLREERNEFD